MLSKHATPAGAPWLYADAPLTAMREAPMGAFGIVERFSPGSEKVVVHGDGVCTVGRSSGKHVSLMGVLRPGTGKLQSGTYKLVEAA